MVLSMLGFYLRQCWAQTCLGQGKAVENRLWDIVAPALAEFLPLMYGNTPARWDGALAGAARLRVIVNALTRLRFCSADGSMDFDTKDGTSAPPPGLMPWFAVPGRASADEPIAFGHWSTLAQRTAVHPKA